MQVRAILGAAILVVAFAVGGAERVSFADEGDIEERIAQFWQRIDAMQPGDYLSSADLGQWALNVIERDSRARLTVADFRAATAVMQAALDRAGPAPVAAQPAQTPAPTSPPVVATPAPVAAQPTQVPTLAPTPAPVVPTQAPVVAPAPTPAPAGGGLTLQTIDGRATLVATDGTYLGLVSSNKYASESICNRYGSHGSPYASDSVRNRYGSYGSPYASESAYNRYTSTPPAIVYDGRIVGYLTKNEYKAGAIDPDLLFALYGCSY